MAYEEADEALSLAKIAIMSKDGCVFFATICLNVTYVWDETIETAQTNGLQIRVNPTYFLAMSAEERAGLIFHEVEHIAFGHIARAQLTVQQETGVDITDVTKVAPEDVPKVKHVLKELNYAADYVINLIALENDFQLPPTDLINYDYKNLSTEDVYQIIKTEDECSPNGPGGAGTPSCSIGQDLQMPDSPEKAAAIQSDIDGLLVQASMQSAMAGEDPGKIPGEIARRVNDLINPKIPWWRLMRSYARKFAKENYTFRKPNRRFFPEHILPTRYSEKMDRCAFIVDASGSVNDDEFSHMVGETGHFMKELRPEMVDFIQFDTSIKSHDELKVFKDLRKVEFKGGGGTDITEVIDWIIEAKPVVSVIFTDGLFNMPATQPKTPVLWVIHENPRWTAPYGRVIHFEFDK